MISAVAAAGQWRSPKSFFTAKIIIRQRTSRLFRPLNPEKVLITPYLEETAPVSSGRLGLGEWFAVPLAIHFPKSLSRKLVETEHTLLDRVEIAMDI